ncbi:uncharacterized protein BO87DRAFT_222714 [Aspergillus neoniger CBS 115656]|uniref:Uncharacterized protein n=1 Tax=Aspergillus neoniger (strain CBS 115656) TaxID=1448310 RepID=A0A318ZMR2_ASPNB|nr:hypothetical protein BO87DRAFT_222714 [Aspergillus neoniger CBS 115656]PYH37172.1 hypothetical protein BO87DRAFT_222714 [Aspergillus neoniger CBS 115656]
MITDVEERFCSDLVGQSFGFRILSILSWLQRSLSFLPPRRQFLGDSRRQCHPQPCKQCKHPNSPDTQRRHRSHFGRIRPLEIGRSAARGDAYTTLLTNLHPIRVHPGGLPYELVVAFPSAVQAPASLVETLGNTRRHVWMGCPFFAVEPPTVETGSTMLSPRTNWLVVITLE